MLLHGSGIKVVVLGNAEGTKQIFICKVHGFHPGGSEKNAGENVQANRPIVKFIGDTALSTKEAQRRLRPVLTGAHLRPRVTMPLIGCAHGTATAMLSLITSSHAFILNSLLYVLFMDSPLSS